jgi:hypothetical protein
VHDEGIPRRDDWPGGVIDGVAAFRQGDLIAGLPLFYWADPTVAIHARTLSYAQQGELEAGVVEFATMAPYGLVTTQTCDLADEGAGTPKSAWVQVAPVFNALSPRPGAPGEALLDAGRRGAIQKGRELSRLWIPDLPEDGFWFADLTFEVPVERGWLARQPRIEGFVEEGLREEVGRRLAWLRSRPAFDTRFVKAVQGPIIEALRKLPRSDGAMYERMHDQVVEIGVLLNGRLAIGQAELIVLHIGVDPDIRAWWQTLWDELVQNATAAGFNLLPLRFANLAELAANEYRAMTRLPLAAVSPNPACYGEDPEAFPLA